MNFAALAIFASLLTTEIMGSVLLLLFWDTTKLNVLSYVVPIWEVTGTFGAFWVVTGDFAFPALLAPVAAIFGALLTVFLILFVARTVDSLRRIHNQAKVVGREETLPGLLTIDAFARRCSTNSNVHAGQRQRCRSEGCISLADWIYSPGSLPFVIGAFVIGIGLAQCFTL